MNATSTIEQLAYTMKELTRVVPMSERKLWDLVRLGKLPHIKCGRRTLFPRDAIVKWLQEQTVGGNS